MIRIGLDAGHYVGDDRVPGAYVKRLGTRDEYILNLRTYNTVAASLSAAGYQVADIGCQSKSVADRAQRAGACGCDAVISLHHNAGGGQGITMFRHSNGILGTQSSGLQDAIYSHLRLVNKGNRSNPVTASVLGVINCRDTRCPSVLIECAFMDNDADVALINSSDYNKRLFAGIMAGCNEYFGIQNKEDDMAIAENWKQRKVTKVFNPFVVRTVAGLPAGDTLKVRVAPDPEAPILETWPELSPGNRVDVIVKYDNGWVAVLIAGAYTGYINAAYLAG